MTLPFNKQATVKSTAKIGSQRIDLKQLYLDLQSLDAQNYGEWPVLVKRFVLLSIVLMTALISYVFPIKNQLNQITAEKNQQQVLQDAYRTNKAKVNQLQSNVTDKTARQQQLNQLSTLLPNKDSIAIPQQLNDLGLSSGVVINDLRVQPEKPQNFYSQLPIRIKVMGDYHQLGQFLGSLSTLPQLITMHDFEVQVMPPANMQQAESPKLILTIDIHTYFKEDNASETVNEIVEAKPHDFNIESDSSNSNTNHNSNSSKSIYQAFAFRSPFSLIGFVKPSDFPNSASDQLNATSQKKDNLNPAISFNNPNFNAAANSHTAGIHLLSQYKYRGMMTSAEQPTFGLIQQPNGLIMRVEVGDKVGEENIRVVEITPTQINLVEQLINSGSEKIDNRLTLIAPVSR